MIGLAAPLGLLALAALVIPVLIHLRRRPPRMIRVGTIRHLPEGAPPPRPATRVSEPLLLAIRCALLALLALALAEPFLRGIGAPASPRRVAVVLDSAADPWSVLRDLDDTLPGGSTIVMDMPARVRVAGNRPALGSDVVIRRVGAAGEAAAPAAVHVVTVATTPSREAAARHVIAAFQAVAGVRGDSLLVVERGSMPPADSALGGWIVWLGDTTAGPARAAARSGARVITEANGSPDTPAVAVRREGSGFLYLLAGPIAAPEFVASGRLPKLIADVWPLRAPIRPERIATSQLEPRRLQGRERDARAPLEMPLLAAAIVLFLLERLLSHRSGRRAVPA